MKLTLKWKLKSLLKMFLILWRKSIRIDFHASFVSGLRNQRGGCIALSTKCIPPPLFPLCAILSPTHLDSLFTPLCVRVQIELQLNDLASQVPTSPKSPLDAQFSAPGTPQAGTGKPVPLTKRVDQLEEELQEAKHVRAVWTCLCLWEIIESDLSKHGRKENGTLAYSEKNSPEA